MAGQKHRAMDHLLGAYEKGGWAAWRIRAAIFGVIVAPVFVLASYSYARTSRDLTDLTFLRRQAIAYLAAVSLRTKFDGLVTVAETSADNDRVKGLVAQGKWDEALEAVRDMPHNLPYVLILSFYSADGRFMASLPRSDELAVGTDLSYRPWYKGVSRTWAPTVSDLGRTATAPYENRVIVSIPLKDEGGKVLGIFNLSVRLDAFLAWSRAIDAGPSSIVYFTDRLGQVAGHKYLSGSDEARLPDQSAFPPVQRALGFDRGIDLLFDPALGSEAVVAYEPVLRYGWTAIVEQTADDAFASRDQNVRAMLVVYALLISLNVLLAFLTIHFIDVIIGLRRREKSFFESVGEGLLVLDRKGAVIMANPASESMLGRRLNAMFGKDIDEVAPLRDEQGRPVPRALRPTMRALAGMKVIERGQYVNADGEPFFINQTAAPVRLDKEIVGAVVAFRDVTKDQLLEQAKNEFVSIASHQLLTPVSAAKGYLSMLLAGDFGDFSREQKEYLGKLFQLNQRMIELVDDLLNLSRVELGVLDTAFEAVDVKEFMRNEIKAIEPSAQKKKIALAEDLDGPVPDVRVPPRLLRVVLQNLLSNAVKYTPEGGRVTVTLRPTKDGTVEHVLFSVTDTGIGIPSKDRERIFTKFYRAENARNSGNDGTGLGLFIVRSVVDALRGTVRFESVEGKGTTFSVEIPVRPPVTGA